MINGQETYIGDGVYVSTDGYDIQLRAPRTGGDHWICLEPAILRALFEYAVSQGWDMLHVNPS